MGNTFLGVQLRKVKNYFSFFGIILYVLHRCCKQKAEKGGHQKTTKSYELQKKSIGIVI